MTISKTSLLFILMMLGLQADISLNDNYGITDDSSKKIQYMLNLSHNLQIKEEQEKQRTQKKLEAVLREKEDLKRNILHVATGFAVLIISVPFICAGAQIGDGFGKYIREHLWPNLDVDKRGWN